MAIHIQNDETDAMIRALANLKGMGITEALHHLLRDTLYGEMTPRDQLVRRISRASRVVHQDEVNNLGYVAFALLPVERTEEVRPGISFEYDAGGRLIGMLIDNPDKVFPPTALLSQPKTAA